MTAEEGGEPKRPIGAFSEIESFEFVVESYMVLLFSDPIKVKACCNVFPWAFHFVYCTPSIRSANDNNRVARGDTSECSTSCGRLFVLR